MKKILITRGAGFIGFHVVIEFVLKYPNYKIINLDTLIYGGNLENLKDIEHLPNYEFIRTDITDTTAILDIFEKFQPDGGIHLASESYVNRSIKNPLELIAKPLRKRGYGEYLLKLV